MYTTWMWASTCTCMCHIHIKDVSIIPDYMIVHLWSVYIDTVTSGFESSCVVHHWRPTWLVFGSFLIQHADSFVDWFKVRARLCFVGENMFHIFHIHWFINIVFEILLFSHYFCQSYWDVTIVGRQWKGEEMEGGDMKLASIVSTTYVPFKCGP